MNKSTPKPFTVRDWTARMILLRRRRLGPIKSRIRRQSVNAVTWPGEQIAISTYPRVMHNITYK